MKRSIAILLALTMALSLFGCADKPEAQEALSPVAPGTDVAESVEPTKPEDVPVTWEYEVTTETVSQEYSNDDGVLLATWSYERPVLGRKAKFTSPDDLPLPDAPEEMETVCKAFNDRFIGYSTQTKNEMSGLQAEAQEQYDGYGEEYRENFSTYENETTVGVVYRHGDLLSVLQTRYDYWGGAHGGTTFVNSHFDLETGEFFTLLDLTDDPDALLQEIKWNLLGKIWEGGETEYYFDDYEDTVLAKEDFNVSFGEDGMTVYFDQYELAPYVMGILEFTIPYAEFSRFLNERGERLLDLPLADRCLGDYYEAEEMWYWFEGAMPQDDADRREVPAEGGSYVMDYYRVDLPGVTTLADLRAKLLTRFAEDVVDERIAALAGAEFPLLREFDGVLYVLPAGRGEDMYIDSVDYRAELNAGETGGKVIATIQWRDYDEVKEEWVLTTKDEAEFPFELTEDGARFTAFQAIW